MVGINYKVPEKDLADKLASALSDEFEIINEKEIAKSPGKFSIDGIDHNSIPDLIIIDGGKGQLKVAMEVLHDLKLDHLKVCGLAKRREEIFLPNEKVSYLFDDKKETLFLLQRIRALYGKSLPCA